MVALGIEDVSDNLGNDGVDAAAEGELNNNKDMVEGDGNEEGNKMITIQEEIKTISLLGAKKAAVDLYNFLLCNLDQRIAKDV